MRFITLKVALKRYATLQFLFHQFLIRLQSLTYFRTGGLRFLSLTA